MTATAEEYMTGTGQLLTRLHAEVPSCQGFGCAIHWPSHHSMRDFPTHWRVDRSLMERICPHGVGHPDPDHMTWLRRTKGDEAADAEGVHGCDGCCGHE